MATERITPQFENIMLMQPPHEMKGCFCIDAGFGAYETIGFLTKVVLGLSLMRGRP